MLIDVIWQMLYISSMHFVLSSNEAHQAAALILIHPGVIQVWCKDTRQGCYL